MKQKTVEIFNEIRNLPYHISINGELGADCENKANMLVAEFKKLNIPARLRIGFFKWANIGLPKHILEIPHDNNCSHTFVEVKISDEWVKIDPTWNPELAQAGFRVASWDGENNTSLAFDCDDFLPVEKTDDYIKNIDREKDMRENGNFYEAINKYCDTYL